MANEKVDLSKTLIQVKAKLIKGGPSNFRELQLETCATCKHSTYATIHDSYLIGCTKYADNKIVHQEIHFYTTCDDWQAPPAINVAELDSTMRVVQFQDSGLQIDKV